MKLAYIPLLAAIGKPSYAQTTQDPANLFLLQQIFEDEDKSPVSQEGIIRKKETYNLKRSDDGYTLEHERLYQDGKQIAERCVLTRTAKEKKILTLFDDECDGLVDRIEMSALDVYTNLFSDGEQEVYYTLLWVFVP